MPQKLRYSIKEAAAMLNVSRSTIYERINDGSLTTIKEGRRRFVNARELENYTGEKVA